MESNPNWSHLITLIVLMSLHRCSHAQPVTSSWEVSTLKESLTKTHFSIIAIAFLSCIIFLIFFSLLVRHCVDSCATTTHVNTAAAYRRRREAIDKCPVLVYSEVMELRIGDSALECAVCLSEFEDTDKIRLLPNCNHVFHLDCIDRWFASCLTCPVCRTKLTTSDGDDNADDAVTEESNHDAEIEQQSTEELLPESPPEETVEVDDESGSSGVPAAAERFGRSHSTGHSLVTESQGVIERYTLRLPEHVREEIFGREERNNILRSCASSSDVVLRGEWSLRKGSDNMERWALLSMTTPPFVSKNWSSLTDQSSSSSSPPSPPRLPV